MNPFSFPFLLSFRFCRFFTAFIMLLPVVLLLASCAPTEEQLVKRAARLHRKALTIDSHVDTPLMLFREGFDIGQRNDPRQGGGKLDFPRMREGGLDAAFFAVFVGQGPLTPEGYRVAGDRALVLFDMIHKAIEDHPEQARLGLGVADAFIARASQKSFIFIGVENGYPLGNDLKLLTTFYERGARYLGLCHSRNNQLCDSSTDPAGELHGGLSAFGSEVVGELNRLGMMVDVTHISDKAFYDVIEVSRAPVIASHSNARAVCDHPRNLTDDMLRALAANGGVVQLCVLSAYVKEMGPEPARDSAFAELRRRYNDFRDLTDEQMEQVRREWFDTDERFPARLAGVADLVDHVDHIVQLIGIDHVGIGTDFDGGGALHDCFDVTELGNITLELKRRGYSNTDIRKIWSGNLLRVLRDVELVGWRE